MSNISGGDVMVLVSDYGKKMEYLTCKQANRNRTIEFHWYGASQTKIFVYTCTYVCTEISVLFMQS